MPAQLQGGANLQSRIRVAPGVAGYDVVLTEIAANVDELAITGKANMAGLLTSQPTFSITFASPTIDLKTLFARMPPQWIHPQLPGIVEQRQLGGTVEIVSATLTGATAPSPQLSLTCDFRVEKGPALIGNDRVPTQDLSAIISVEPGRIRVGKVTGSYWTLQMTDGKAVVSFLDEGPWMELDISGNMTAADLVTTSDVEIVNPEQYLATLDSPEASLELELVVEKGKEIVNRDDRAHQRPQGSIVAQAVKQIEAMPTRQERQKQVLVP